MMTRYKACGAVALGCFLIFGIFQGIGAEENEGKALFEEKCGMCHPIDRAKSLKKSREGWEATVMRMKNRNAAPITEEEAKKIIDYLAKTYGP